MTKFSLSSLHKKIRGFLYCVVAACVFVAIINISVSILINKSLKDASRRISEVSPGLSFSVRFSYFNILRGVTMYGIECRKNGEPVLSSRRADFGFDVLSLKDRKFRIKNMRFRQLHLNPEKAVELGHLLDKSLWDIKMPLDLYETVYFSGFDVWMSDSLLADINGYFSLIKGNLVSSRGDVMLKRIQVPAFPDADLFRDSSFYKRFDYLFEAEFSESDFIISRFELGNPLLKFSGSGRIENYRLNPKINFGIDFLNIILDDFPALNQDFVRTQGVIDANLKISGQPDSLNVFMTVKFSGVEVKLYDALFLTKINGKAVVGHDHLVGQNFSLLVNNIPFNADFVISQGTYPHLLLKLFSSEKIAESPAFVFDMEADGIGKELVGKAKARMRYSARSSINTFECALEDFHFGYEDELFISARNLNVDMSVQPTEQVLSGKETVFVSSLAVDQFFSVFKRTEEGFALDNIKGVCYGGTLEGKVDFITQQDKLNLKGEGHLREVDLGEFLKSRNENQFSLVGRLDGDVRIDTSLIDMFKGQLFVSKGSIKKNPLLDAVSDFLGVPSLKNVNFDELSVFFSGGRGEYSSQVKLVSSVVEADLDGKIISYDKMDGFLNISLTTELLNESKQFKKILTYIRHDEPSVLFSFKISSYLNSPRVLWLKNAFKEKLSNLLPERNKRYLQRQVNSMVEKIEEE